MIDVERTVTDRSGVQDPAVAGIVLVVAGTACSVTGTANTSGRTATRVICWICGVVSGVSGGSSTHSAVVTAGASSCRRLALPV